MMINLRKTAVCNRILDYCIKKEEIIERKNNECSKVFLVADGLVEKKNIMPTVLSSKSEIKHIIK